MRGVAFAVGAAMLAAGCTGHAPQRDGSAAGLTAASLPPPPSVDCPAPVLPPGRYVTNIPGRDISTGSDRAFVSGSWTWTISVPDFHCYFSMTLTRRVNGNVLDVEVPFYTVAAPNRVVIHWCCSIPDGTYEVSVQGDHVRLTKIHDAETEFAAILVTEPWTREPGAST
jgi:hypothetical protein